MRYTHPSVPLEIEAIGGYRALENLGFISDEQRVRMERKAREREKLNEFLTRRKAEVEAREKEIWQ